MNNFKPKYVADYEDFWKEIVENPDGTLNKDKIMMELSDYSWLIGNVNKVYDHVTGGRISKANSDPGWVITYADDRMREEAQLIVQDELEEIIEKLKGFK